MSHNPYAAPSPFAELPAVHDVEPKYSRLGIASFVMSVLVGMSMFAMFVVAGIMEASSPGGIQEESAQAVILGLVVFGLLFLDLLALSLGIAGLCERNRRKLFAVLGLCISLTIGLGTVGLIALGLAMS